LEHTAKATVTFILILILRDSNCFQEIIAFIDVVVKGSDLWGRKTVFCFFDYLEDTHVANYETSQKQTYPCSPKSKKLAVIAFVLDTSVTRASKGFKEKYLQSSFLKLAMPVDI
jgi:hypothetical protein